MAAASSGSARVLRAILETANIADELMMPIRMHALHEAAKNGHLEVIQVRTAINHSNTNTNTTELVWRPLQTKFGQGRLSI